MLPVIALVGRPNVGKSTLFNCLTRSRDALVADQPGLTRDRNYGIGKVGPHPYIVVDTGGLSGRDDELDSLMAKQVGQAMAEADVILFMVDAQVGVTPGDEIITRQLRQLGKPILLVINKIDGLDSTLIQPEFHSLGLGMPISISAAHGKGVTTLTNQLFELLPAAATDSEEELPDQGIRIAVVGRPNVGKSTLINRMLGEERVLVFDMAGTTRDSISIPFEREGVCYTLIDTAGVRRRSRVSEAIEKFSVIKAMQAIESAHVVIHLIDARDGVTDQDASLLGFVLDSGRALVIAVNKWDGLSTDQRERIKMELERKLSFVSFARIHFISALHGTGVGNLYPSIHRAYDSARMDLSTPILTRTLEQALISHQPPLVKGRRIKLRYAHQGGQNPPVIIIHGSQAEAVPDSYRRYLVNVYRKALKLEGTPIRLEFKSGANPYKDKKNVLTKRQQDKRKRMLRFVKKHK